MHAEWMTKRRVTFLSAASWFILEQSGELITAHGRLCVAAMAESGVSALSPLMRKRDMISLCNCAE